MRRGSARFILLFCNGRLFIVVFVAAERTLSRPNQFVRASVLFLITTSCQYPANSHRAKSVSDFFFGGGGAELQEHVYYILQHV